MEEITNKVKNSGIITIDLTDYLPQNEIIEIDLAQNLWQGLVLKEKDFRTYIAEENWAKFQGKIATIFCSADAIIPTWAYMLVASSLVDYATEIYVGNKAEATIKYVSKQIEQLNEADFSEARVVIKGCAAIENPETLFLELTTKLRPVVKSLMYGEPCSTVPVYKKKKEETR